MRLPNPQTTRNLSRRLTIAVCAWGFVFVSKAHAAAISDPAQAMETWLRLKGDSAGAITYEWMTGTAYGLPDEQVSVPLFRIESVTLRQFKKVGVAEFLEQTYACRLYRDASSDVYISHFVNPLTKLDVPLRVRCSAGQTVRYTSERVSLVADIKFESTALNVPLRLERINAGDKVILKREASSQYRSQATGELRRETSLDTFTVDAKALANPRVTNLPASYQWTSVTQWMPELGMAGLPGRMLWSVNGRKYQRSSELPATFRLALERTVPGALAHRFEWRGMDSNQQLPARPSAGQ